MKKTPTILWFNIVVWSFSIYYIINKWKLITSGKYWPIIIWIGCLVVTEIIWLTIWVIKNRKFKTIFFYSITASIILNILITFTYISDLNLIKADLYLNSQDRLEVVELTLKAKKNIPMKGKYEYLSIQDSDSKYFIYGCPVVLLDVYHGWHGLFDYGNNGYLVYVSDEKTFSPEEFCKDSIYNKREIKRIKDNWYFATDGW